MRLWILLLAGCVEEKDGGVSCGPGTVEVGGECVPEVSGGGSGGSDSNGGGEREGEGEGEGEDLLNDTRNCGACDVTCPDSGLDDDAPVCSGGSCLQASSAVCLYASLTCDEVCADQGFSACDEAYFDAAGALLEALSDGDDHPDYFDDGQHVSDVTTCSAELYDGDARDDLVFCVCAI